MDKSPQTETKIVRLLPNSGVKNSTIFVLGATRVGKTTLVANLLLRSRRFVVFDTKKDYDPSFFGPNVEICYDGNGLVNLLNEGKRKILVDLSRYEADDAAEVLSGALLSIYDSQLANFENAELPPITVAIDEINKFVEVQSAPLGVREIIQRGSGVRIEKILGAQWFGTIPAWVRESFTEIYTFKHVDPAGLRRLESYGFNPDEVKNLPRYTVLHYDGVEVKQVRLVASDEQISLPKTNTGDN